MAPREGARAPCMPIIQTTKSAWFVRAERDLFSHYERKARWVGHPDARITLLRTIEYPDSDRRDL